MSEGLIISDRLQTDRGYLANQRSELLD